MLNYSQLEMSQPKKNKNKEEKLRAIYDYKRQMLNIEWNLKHVNEETERVIKIMKSNYQRMIEEYKNEYGEEP